MADPKNPLLDGDDIQGNIFPGFQRQGRMLVGYRAPSEHALRAALAVLAPRVTPLPPVLDHRDGRKNAFIAGDPAPQMPELWTNLALGASALDRLGEKAVRALDEAFDVGMRPIRTGDPWKVTDAQGKPNPACPANWVIGRPSDPLDLLLILAFDDWDAAGGADLLRDVEAAGLVEIHRDTGVRLDNDSEHFGFADGISEVGVRGVVKIREEERLLTSRYGVPPRDGLEFGRPGQVLAWPGQFFVGAHISETAEDPAPAKYKNGAFLVFRRLAQDVRAFDDETQRLSQSLSAAGTPVTAESLRAMIVGRWRSGAALMRHAHDPGSGDPPIAANYFDFGVASPDLNLAEGHVDGAVADAAPVRGLNCPAFAHIRKVNPRDLATDKGDAALTRSFQMLRRGFPFGPRYDRANPGNAQNGTPRGLLFLAYQRSISLGFDQLNRDWMNIEKGPGPGGFDLLVGQRVDPETGVYLAKTATLYNAPSPAPGRDMTVSSTWVTPTGGAYLFAPSLSLIRALAAPPVVASASELRAIALERHVANTLSVSFDAATPEIGPHDGVVTRRAVGGRELLIDAAWRTTAMLSAAAGNLGGAFIDSLDLSGQHFPVDALSPQDAAALAEQPELHGLAVDGITLDGPALARLIGRLPRLAKLDIAGCDLDDADVATIAHARPSIEEISVGLAPIRSGHRFGAPRVGTGLLKSLETFTSLRSVGLRGTKISDAAAAGSDLWDRVERVDLGETRISDATALRLARSTALREVELDRTLITDVGAKAMLSATIEGISLAETLISTACFEGRLGERIARLDLAGTAVDDRFGNAGRSLAALRNVDLSRTAVADDTADAMAAARSLDRLNVARTRISVRGVGRLAGCRVAELDLRGLPTDADALKRFAASPYLRELKLSATRWDGLSEIAALVDLEAPAEVEGAVPERLRTLWCRGKLDEASARTLAGGRSLNSIAIDGDVSAARFESGFPALRDFRAENAKLDDAALSGLLKTEGIEALYISGNPVGEALNGIDGRFIHTLELRHTRVDDRAIAALGRLPRLHCLDLPFTGVSPKGVAELVEHARNLQSLAVDASQVDVSTARAFARHPRLLELYLYGDQVDNATLRRLQAVPIRDFSLVDTGIDDGSVPTLAGMPRLRALRLGDELSTAGLNSLRALRPDVSIEATSSFRPRRRIDRMP